MRALLFFCVLVVIVLIAIVIWWNTTEDPIVVDNVMVSEVYRFAEPHNTVFSCVLPDDAKVSVSGRIDRHKVNKANSVNEFYLLAGEPCTISIQRLSNSLLYRPRVSQNGKRCTNDSAKRSELDGNI